MIKTCANKRAAALRAMLGVGFSCSSALDVKPLLRSPLYGLVSRKLMLITFTGRKSGKTYATPVEYLERNGSVTAFTRRNREWWKNLQGGAPAVVRLRGQDVPGTAEAFTADTSDLCAEMRQIYPYVSEKKIAEIMPLLVMVRIRLSAAR